MSVPVGGVVYLPPGYLPPWYTYTLGIPTPLYTYPLVYLPPGIPTPRHQYLPPPWVDTCLWKYYLPATTVVGNKNPSHYLYFMLLLLLLLLLLLQEIPSKFIIIPFFSPWFCSSPPSFRTCNSARKDLGLNIGFITENKILRVQYYQLSFHEKLLRTANIDNFVEMWLSKDTTMPLFHLTSQDT